MFPQQAPPEWQYYVNPWWREKHVYTTHLSKPECERRLNADTTRWLGRSVARSLVSAADFTLHRVTFYNNGFRPYAYLEFDGSTPPETVVRLTFASSNSVQLFFVVWYLFLAVFTTVALASTFGHQPTTGGAVPLLFIAPFIAWPLLLTALGRGIAYRDRGFLADFLVRELELKPAQILSGIAIG